MEDLKLIIAKNISTLRRDAKMTQFDLAEKLNYSDKAISKWERGESIPDVIVLKQVAEIFSVTVDYLLEEEHGKKANGKTAAKSGDYIKNRVFITGMALMLVWLIALIAFVAGDMFREYIHNMHWMIFLWAVPPMLIVWLVLNSVWFNPRLNFLIVSLLMWSVLATIHISVLLFLSINIRLLYILGIPGQIIIIFWSRIKTSS